MRDLKQGYAALEERARSDLGMIAGNETFYQVVPQSGAAGRRADCHRAAAAESAANGRGRERGS